jgi:hypothetical protein
MVALTNILDLCLHYKNDSDNTHVLSEIGGILTFYQPRL